ncbi:MAG: ABC transporter substrate-binding protein [Xanthobacteraceae bacterium]
MRRSQGGWLKVVFVTALVAGAGIASATAAEKIKIGNLAPYSGPASAYGIFGKIDAAYMRMLNERGGIKGRQIEFISYDDAYSPPKAVEQTRRLVENDDVLLIFNAVGTPTNSAIQKYLNTRKVPQLFSATGATKFGDPKNFPWTMGWASSVYGIETAIYARYIKDSFPNAKVAVLMQNDDFGKDLHKGFKDGFGEDASKYIVAEATYDVTDATIDSQLVKLKASGADVLVDFTTPRFAAQAIRKLAELDWKPVHILSNAAANINSVFRPSGIENAKGILTANSVKEPGDPRWKDDPGVKEFLTFMDKYYPEGDRTNYFAAISFMASQLLQKVLEQCGDDLSRENVMKQATNLKGISLGMLLPGITINTSPTNYFPISQMQMIRFNGEGWDPVGEVQTATVKD